MMNDERDKKFIIYHSSLEKMFCKSIACQSNAISPPATYERRSHFYLLVIGFRLFV
jgi:hypothetical protein